MGNGSQYKICKYLMLYFFIPIFSSAFPYQNYCTFQVNLFVKKKKKTYVSITFQKLKNTICLDFLRQNTKNSCTMQFFFFLYSTFFLFSFFFFAFISFCRFEKKSFWSGQAPKKNLSRLFFYIFFTALQ